MVPSSYFLLLPLLAIAYNRKKNIGPLKSGGFNCTRETRFSEVISDLKSGPLVNKSGSQTDGKLENIALCGIIGHRPLRGRYPSHCFILIHLIHQHRGIRYRWPCNAFTTISTHYMTSFSRGEYEQLCSSNKKKIGYFRILTHIAEMTLGLSQKF